MKINNPMVAVATQKEHPNETLIGPSMKEFYDYKSNIKRVYYTNNKKPLPYVYNEAINAAYSDMVDCLILVHDDVILEEDPIPKLEKLFDDYDLIGVAGTTKAELKPPALWHLMGGGFGGGNLRGQIYHINGKGNPELTTFGPSPHRVIMIDGVFMALNRKVIETMLFDEKCPSGFHFYDLIFSLECHKQWLKVGVGDIQMTHKSHGLKSFTEEWLKGQEYFLNKYDN